MTSTLRNQIEMSQEEYGCSLKDLTVLSPQRDPYRLDTPANHNVGRWLAGAIESVGHSVTASRIHLRGLHYKLVGRVSLPNGEPYINSADCWLFMSEKASKAGRYLGYVPWDAIKDARNAAPLVFKPEFTQPHWVVSTADVEVYLPDDLKPRFSIKGNMSRQKYQQIIIAEKQGVVDLLEPVCNRLGATLATPAGEVSDSMLYDLLADAADDGRPLVVHQLADFDPAGRQMAVSTSRTIQALVDTQFPGLQVTVHDCALTREHCEEWGLPSTPLKATELRADRWQSAMGWDQTELDAAVAMVPRKFASVVGDALSEYIDWSVESDASELRSELIADANRRLGESLDDHIEAIRETVTEKLDQLETLASDINESLSIDLSALAIDLPSDIEVLTGEPEPISEPLIDTDDCWIDNTLRLKARKEY